MAAQKRLHTAQPSLSRQMRALEYDVGVELMTRSARGIELTPAGRAFLDHARLALAQVEAAHAAARRAGMSCKASFAVGFPVGQEADWLPKVTSILRDELPNTDLTVYSQCSPDLALALRRGQLDLAFLRPERDFDDLEYRVVTTEPIVAFLPSDHRLAYQDTIGVEDLAHENFLGRDGRSAPVFRTVIDEYLARSGVIIRPNLETDNIVTAVSLVSSARCVALGPAFAKISFPPSVTRRPLRGEAPTIDLVIGYNKSNNSPILKRFLSRVDDLIAALAKTAD